MIKITNPFIRVFMKYYPIILILILASCQPNRYTAVDGVDNSSDAKWSAWRACNKEAYHKYSEGQAALGSGPVFGLIAGGALGGAIGGAAFGAAMDSGDQGGVMKRSDIGPYTEKCMNDKGYAMNHN